MVCAESLCCGTPVVGFNAGGPETIALPEYSIFVEQGQDDKLEEALNKIFETKIDKRVIAQKAIETYGQDTMCKKYYNVYNKLHEEQLQK